MTYSVAQQPLGHLSVEQRAEIASQVLHRYMAGEQIADMAPEYDTSDVTLYAVLLREHQDAWKEVQTARALARLERHQQEMKDAKDALSLARGRELVRSAQWELERLLRRLYGQDQVPASLVSVHYNIGIGRNPGTESVQVVDSVETVADKSSA